jgi:hypothetical protein
MKDILHAGGKYVFVHFALLIWQFIQNSGE